MVQFIKKSIKYRGFIGKTPAIWRMLKAWKTGVYKTSSWRIIVILLGLVYIISPVDFISGIVIPLVGTIDDLLVFSFIIPKLIKEIDKFLLWEKLQQHNL